jgi:hypothetical protein
MDAVHGVLSPIYPDEIPVPNFHLKKHAPHLGKRYAASPNSKTPRHVMTNPTLTGAEHAAAASSPSRACSEKKQCSNPGQENQK